MKYSKQLIQAFFLSISFVLIASCSGITSSSTVDLASLPNNYEQVALLLPLHGAYAGPGNAVRDGFLAGYYNNGGGNLNVKVYDTTSNPNIKALYAQAIADGAQIVIGPLVKSDVATLANSDIKVPTIALNYIDKNNPPSLFFEFGISPQNEASQVATKANSAGLNRAIIIAPQESWGQAIVSSFTQQWQQSGGSIAASLNYSSNTDLRSAISNLLQASAEPNSNSTSQRRTDFDSIFLVATPDVGRQIVPLLNYYYANNIPKYSISLIYSGVQNVNYNRDMDGVIFDDIPWIFTGNAPTNDQQNISKLWPADYRSYSRLYALGLDAFNLVHNLKQLPTAPGSGISGDTGQLYLGPKHWIMQKFIFAEFKNGKAVRIN